MAYVHGGAPVKANVRDHQEMTGSLESKVASWLRDQGYPLEMEAAWIGKDCGFDVSQADYYIDPENDQAREIDLVLTARKFVNRFSVSYNLFVECKSSRDKPWLLFSTENYLLPPYTDKYSIHPLTVYSAVIANDLGRDLLLQSMFDGSRENIYPRLDTAPTLAYGVTQAFSQGSDVPFKALMSASKAALSHVKRFGDLEFLAIPFEFATPVVVIDVPLLSVVYTPGSPDLDIREVNRGLLLWKHMVGGRSRIGVYIVQRSELSSFFADCYKSASWWTSQPEDTFQKILDKKKSQTSK
jgi:hypothetical protein